eukprot:INCI14643.1.p1 GENE.INCI14643.1~~INCI14643.1.p1  ORF type:complete len:457 (+),score=80.38 INCI14643.1:454-1824(+)
MDGSTLDPGSGWSVAEDNILIAAYINDRMSFEQLTRQLPGKTREQCEARWLYYMQQTGNKGAWTRHEDQILHVCQKGYGNRWKSIKNFLPGRSENAVKNRWNAILRKTAPSPTDTSDNRSGGAAGDTGYYGGESNGGSANRQQQARSAVGTVNDGNLSSSDMHLRLSPGAFGINSDSPGPADGQVWGANTSGHTSFSFFPQSPGQTPQKSAGMGQRTGGSADTAGAGNTPLALKVDTNAPYGYDYRRGGTDSKGSGKSLDESTSSMSREDMTELADAFVAQEVEKFRKQTGETMSEEDQLLIRKAFVAGMQHSPPEKEMSGSDLQWEFDQSGSIDAMISMDEDHGHFDGVVQGHAIFSQSGAKSPDKFSRSGMSIGASSSAVGAGLLPRTGSQGADMNLSIEGHSWGGPLHSDLLNTDNLDEMSMSLLNMSLEESQDHMGGGGGTGGGPPGGGFHP